MSYEEEPEGRNKIMVSSKGSLVFDAIKYIKSLANQASALMAPREVMIEMLVKYYLQCIMKESGVVPDECTIETIDECVAPYPLMHFYRGATIHD